MNGMASASWLSDDEVYVASFICSGSRRPPPGPRPARYKYRPVIAMIYPALRRLIGHEAKIAKRPQHLGLGFVMMNPGTPR